MSLWINQSPEERALLNPAFCSCLIWQSAREYHQATGSLMSFDLAFLVLPVVLHKEIRELLPGTSATSLAVWLNEHPLVQSHIADRSQMLSNFTKAALLFGGTHLLFEITPKGKIKVNETWRQRIARSLKDTSDEVRYCMTRAKFVGKWFAISGNSDTIMALVGVRL